VVSNIFYFPFHIWDVIFPIDFHIFQRGGSTTNQFCVFCWAKNLAINGASTMRQEKQSEELRELDRKFEEPMDFSFIQL
jgi:hypothetical protein